jgi:hypothetical protein
LTILQELWNTDKHRTISQVVTLFQPVHLHGDRGLRGFEASSRPVKDGMVIDRWRTPPPRPPKPDGSEQRDEYYTYWKKAVTRTFDWFEADEG